MYPMFVLSTWVHSNVVQVQCLLGAIETFCHALLFRINNQFKMCY